jgi:hypothetical protein
MDWQKRILETETGIIIIIIIISIIILLLSSSMFPLNTFYCKQNWIELDSIGRFLDILKK